MQALFGFHLSSHHYWDLFSVARLSRVCEVEMSAWDHRSKSGICYAQDAVSTPPSSPAPSWNAAKALASESDKKMNWHSRSIVGIQYFWYGASDFHFLLVSN